MKLPLITATSWQSFPPRGSLGTRLTIFADFCDSKNKARGRLYIRGRLYQRYYKISSALSARVPISNSSS